MKKKHDVDPKPKGKPVKYLVVDRNEWRQGNDDEDRVATAHFHKDHTWRWARRFDYYVLVKRRDKLKAACEEETADHRFECPCRICIGLYGPLRSRKENVPAGNVKP